MAQPKVRIKGFEGEWETRTFGSLGTVAMCKRIFKDQTSNHGHIPFYKIGTFGSTPDAFISREIYEEYKKKYEFPQKGDILISAAGTIGRVVEYYGEDAYYQDSNIVWLKHNDEIENSFLKYLYSVITWKGLEGATIKRLYNNIFLGTEIKMPSKKEQSVIASYFHHLDSLIQFATKKIESIKQVKVASLQSMFPQDGEKIPRVRFKGFEGEWKEKRLGELFDFLKGKGLSKEKLSETGKFPCILYGEIFTRYDFCAQNCYSRTDCEEGVDSKDGDILMPGSTTTIGVDLAKAVTVNKDGIKLGGDIIILRAKDINEINPYFMATELSCLQREKIAMVAQGITIIHLHGKDLVDLRYSIPDQVQEQNKIAAYFASLDSQISIQEQRLEKLKQIKVSCLEKMFV